MQKSKKKRTKKRAGTESLTVINLGNTVIIKDRSSPVIAISSVAMLVITVICAVAMRAAHRSPLFWTVAVALVAGLTYSAVKAILAKMVLDANKMTMTIYNPSAKCYKFSDVNYVDSGTVNDRNGEEVFIVTVYMGDGRRSIDVATYSKEQAKEVERLMCAMFSYTGDTDESEDKADEAENEEQQVKISDFKRSTVLSYRVPRFIEKDARKSDKMVKLAHRRAEERAGDVSGDEPEFINKRVLVPPRPTPKPEIEEKPDPLRDAPELIKKADPNVPAKATDKANDNAPKPEIEENPDPLRDAPELIKKTDQNEPVKTAVETDEHTSDPQPELEYEPLGDIPELIKKQAAEETREPEANIPDSTTEPDTPSYDETYVHECTLFKDYNTRRQDTNE